MTTMHEPITREQKINGMANQVAFDCRNNIERRHRIDGIRRKQGADMAEAVRQDPSYSAAWKLYGRVLLDAERYREAVDVLARGVEIAQDKGDNQAAREMQVFAKRAAKQVDATPGGSGQSD